MVPLLSVRRIQKTTTIQTASHRLKQVLVFCSFSPSVVIEPRSLSIVHLAAFNRFWATVCTRNSSGDKIANVNFLTTTPSTTLTQCAPEATEFGEITKNNGHYAVQGHLRSPIWYQSKARTVYDFLLVINTNLPPSSSISEIQLSIGTYFATPLAFNPSPRPMG